MFFFAMQTLTEWLEYLTVICLVRNSRNAKTELKIVHTTGQKPVLDATSGRNKALFAFGKACFQHSWPLFTTPWPGRSAKSHFAGRKCETVMRSSPASYGNSEQCFDLRPAQP